VHELTSGPDPVSACARFADLPYVLFLDSAARHSEIGRYSFVAADPVVVIRQRAGARRAERVDCASGVTTELSATALDAVRAELQRVAAPAIPGLPPFQGGFAGFISYEWGTALEGVRPAGPADSHVPDFMFALYDWVIAWDHAEGRAWVVSTGIDGGVEDDGDRRNATTSSSIRRAEERSGHRLRMVLDRLEGPFDMLPDDAPEPAPELTSSFTRAGYLSAVARTRELILAGDIFQANLSQRFSAPLREPPFALYRRLRERAPAPFAAFLSFPGVTIASASPERFLRVDVDGAVETRPIKGTRPRGASDAEDQAFARELVTSEKDRAENVMITDLLRNDLSRVCAPGSVHVTALCALEQWATVHHLVSAIVGRLEPGRDTIDLLLATLPGGSISGAPKIRAMEIIAEAEPVRRGIYCGTVGYLSRTGAMDSSVVIRTFVCADGTVTFGAGGGIVADSDPDTEYEETLHKARALMDALSGSARHALV
jgi:para-aminobenzoate synthetase component 1